MATTQDGDGQASSKRQIALSWNEDEIISVYKQTPQVKPNNCAVTGFVFPPEHPVAYVKSGYLPESMQEVKNHEYAFKALKAMPPGQTRGILIPEIYRTFERDHMIYIVMEYVPGSTLAQIQEQQDWESRERTVIHSIARAFELLRSIPVPPGQKPGPVSGGLIRHPLFKDDTSSCEYPTVYELEEHLNKVRNHKCHTPPPFTLLSISTDRLATYR